MLLLRVHYVLQQYLQNEPADNFLLWDVDRHPRKVQAETAFRWVWLGMPWYT